MRQLLVLLTAFSIFAAPVRADDAVTEWTLLADRLGDGAANWRTLAIMHQAMHDAGNAALPIYERWFPPSPDEPRPTRATPQAAMAGAAMRVLVELHSNDWQAVDGLYRTALARLPDDAETRAGAWLGDAIGRAAVDRRVADGFSVVKPFTKGDAPGRWRPTPNEFANSNTTETQPFLFRATDEVPAPPPPAPGSPAFVEAIAEALQIGGADSPSRTPEQSDAALYWAYQSSQRGYIRLAVSLLDAHPRPGALAARARIMSQVAAAMADSAVLVWAEKERFSYWRPITAIRAGADGITPDPDWEPLIATPAHPEYPSGHAADCFVGSGTLQAAFADVRTAITYVAQPGHPPEDNVGMGQHAQFSDSGLPASRVFADLALMAEQCSNSRIWAGAHFRAAAEEARRLGVLISNRATARVPPLP